MKKYVNPIYINEAVETEDVILASGIVDNGNASLGGVEGEKGSASFDFSDIF